MKNFFKKARQIKWVRVMCWKILSAMIAGVGALLLDLKGPEFVFVVTIGTQVIDFATKYVNTQIFKDLGVAEKK